MNIANRLPALLLKSAPELKAETSSTTTPSAQPTAKAAQTKVDGFDAKPRVATPVTLLPPPVEDSTTPRGAVIKGATDFKPLGSVGPRVLTEPIQSETKARVAPKDFKPVSLDVPWYSQFSDHGAVKGGGTSCNAMVKEMMASGKSTAVPGGRDDASNFNIAEAKDTQGRITPNAARAAEALSYVDAQLDAGKPVMVGVTWYTPKPGFNGGNADHYVVVTGRGVDDEGRAFYKFHDPGATAAAKGSDARKENRFYVDDATSMLFRPGNQLPPGKMYTTDARYEVSQVRKNQ